MVVTSAGRGEACENGARVEKEAELNKEIRKLSERTRVEGVEECMTHRGEWRREGACEKWWHRVIRGEC